MIHSFLGFFFFLLEKFSITPSLHVLMAAGLFQEPYLTVRQLQLDYLDFEEKEFF